MPIRHTRLARILQARILQARILQSRILQSRILQALILTPRIHQARIHQARILQARIHQVRILQARTLQARILQARILQARILQARIHQARILTRPQTPCTLAYMVHHLPTGWALRAQLLLRPRTRLFDCAKDLDFNRLGLLAMTISRAKKPIRFKYLTRTSRLSSHVLIFAVVKALSTSFRLTRSMYGTVLRRLGSICQAQPSVPFLIQAGVLTQKKLLE